MMQTPVTFCLIAHLHRQRAFSEKTFGPGARTQGVVDHIRKELVEIEAKPRDLKEWVDVILLGLDGAWRAGYTPEEIAFGIYGKHLTNEQRNWPDWRTADPNKAIEHDRSGEAPAAFAIGDEVWFDGNKPGVISDHFKNGIGVDCFYVRDSEGNVWHRESDELTRRSTAEPR